MVEVTQGARDAAWPFMDVIAYDGEARLRAGEYDDNAFIQAIAEAEARGVQQGLDMAAAYIQTEYPFDKRKLVPAIRKLGGGDA